LKRKIENKARVEASICNAYLIKEISNFFSHYFGDDVETKAEMLGEILASVMLGLILIS